MRFSRVSTKSVNPPSEWSQNFTSNKTKIIMSNTTSDTAPYPPNTPPPPFCFWCSVCELDLQSEKSLAEHELGVKHRKRKQRQAPNEASSTIISRYCPVIDENDFFENLASGIYKNIVVLTGAGVSTAAGIPDFRSPGGLYDTIQRQYNEKFPGITPETFFSRAFAQKYPDLYENEIFPSKQKALQNAEPTLTHHFCAYLSRKGWLRRIYTSNIDRLHLHPSLGIDDEEVVVECHGSIHNKETLVLYGDPLPERFFQSAAKDFSINPRSENDKVDLVLVFGTSLQVAPVCGLPNMALKGCTRVLVNRDLSVCMLNGFSVRSSSMGMTRMCDTCDIGGRKNVQLRPLWRDRKRRKKWSQLLVEDDCDAFVERFMEATETSVYTG